jgi:RimJ/RimL family protein N-acetyltransferase
VALFFGQSPEGFKNPVAIGFRDGEKIVGGIVYENFKRDCYNEPLSISCTIVSLDKRWATRNNIRALFAYPFITLKVRRFEAETAKHNQLSNSILLRLGFSLEGCAREAWPYGGDANLYSILSTECNWLK